MTTLLFSPKPDELKKNQRISIRLTSADNAALQLAASEHNLSLSDYLVRVGLNRRVEVDYATDLVLGLSDSVRALRELCQVYRENGATIPQELVAEAMSRISGVINRIHDLK